MQPKHILIINLLGFTLFTGTIFSQSVYRVEVEGFIYSETNDVEAVTIFNTSSNAGTITNADGYFKIKVAINDIIEISALQFHTTTVKIDKAIFDSRKLKIHLVEEVNQLEAVSLSSGLTGNMLADIKNVKPFVPIKIDMGNLNAPYEYNDDAAFNNSLVENDLKAITSPGQFYGGVNLGAIFKLIKGDKKKKPKEKIDTKKDDIVDFNLSAEELKFKNFRKSNEDVLASFFKSNSIDGIAQESFLWYCLESPEFVSQVEIGTDLEVLDLFNAKFVEFKQMSK